MNHEEAKNSPDVSVSKTKPNVDQLGLGVIEKLRRGECAYLPRPNDNDWLYIPLAKAASVSELHKQVFNGSNPLSVSKVDELSYMMELPHGASPAQVEELIRLIDAEASKTE